MPIWLNILQTRVFPLPMLPVMPILLISIIFDDDRFYLFRFYPRYSGIVGVIGEVDGEKTSLGRNVGCVDVYNKRIVVNDVIICQ